MSPNRRKEIIFAVCFVTVLALVTGVLAFGEGERDWNYWVKVFVVGITWAIFLVAYIWRGLGQLNIGGSIGERVFAALVVIILLLFLLAVAAGAWLNGTVVPLIIVVLAYAGIFSAWREHRQRKRRQQERDAKPEEH